MPAPQRIPPLTGAVVADVVDAAGAIRLLSTGELAIEGRLVEASNTTLRAIITLDDATARCVYKPIRGERSLWDFPDGSLAGREVAAYLVSEATGWGMVPPTVMRDGPLGRGACQLWIDEPDDVLSPVGFVPADELPDGWLAVAAARAEDGRRYVLAHADEVELAQMALFDAVVNNADRKGGHVLRDESGRLYGVDHGVCFHVEDKLRTVLWGWIGRPLPSAETSILATLCNELRGDLGAALRELVDPEEVTATLDRAQRLLDSGVFPSPVPDWPAMPWPPI